MFKNKDFEDTYCSEDAGNVRYPSSAKKSIRGWAYIYTMDQDYVDDLAYNHHVETKVGEDWVSYCGQKVEQTEVEAPPQANSFSAEVMDPNY